MNLGEITDAAHEAIQQGARHTNVGHWPIRDVTLKDNIVRLTLVPAHSSNGMSLRDLQVSLDRLIVELNVSRESIVTTGFYDAQSSAVTNLAVTHFALVLQTAESIKHNQAVTKARDARYEALQRIRDGMLGETLPGIYQMRHHDGSYSVGILRGEDETQVRLSEHETEAEAWSVATSLADHFMSVIVWLHE